MNVATEPALLDADAHVIQAWHAAHPAMAPLQRTPNVWKSRPTRDAFITRFDAHSRAANARFLSQGKSSESHVVGRVGPDGHYQIFATDSRDERDTLSFVRASRPSKLLGA